MERGEEMQTAFTWCPDTNSTCPGEAVTSCAISAGSCLQVTGNITNKWKKHAGLRAEAGDAHGRQREAGSEV